MSNLYKHFSERLQERYGISCTIEEWRTLSNYSLQDRYDNHDHTEGGVTRFKGVKIHLIKLVKGDAITVLSLDKAIVTMKRPKRRVNYKEVRRRGDYKNRH